MGRNNHDKTQRPSISDVFSALFESSVDVYDTLSEDHPVFLWTVISTIALILLTCWQPAAARRFFAKLLVPVFVLADLTIVPIIAFILRRLEKEADKARKEQIYSPGGPASAAMAS